MRIDVWSDVVCPWCWLGNARLEKALATSGHRDEIEVVLRSFQLDPTTPRDLDIPTSEMIAQKLGIGPAQLQAMHERLTGLGKTDGIDFRFEQVRTSNTFDAHQVLHLARSHGKQEAMAAHLFRANFHDGVRIGDRKELVKLAAEVGLDPAEVEEALEDQRFAQAVRDDQTEARRLGIQGVPFFVAEGGLAVSGAQSVEVLGRMLDAAWAKRS